MRLGSHMIGWSGGKHDANMTWTVTAQVTSSSDPKMRPRSRAVKQSTHMTEVEAVWRSVEGVNVETG